MYVYVCFPRVVKKPKTETALVCRKEVLLIIASCHPNRCTYSERVLVIFYDFLGVSKHKNAKGNISQSNRAK